MPVTRIIAIAASLAIVALLGVLYVVSSARGEADAYASCRAGQVAGGVGAIGGPFTLVNQDGETVSEAEVITRPSLIYFGYTFCPDVCPFDVARNAEAVDLLAEAGHEVTPVFISVDPARDTPEVLKDYAGYMHPDLVALTGSEAQVKEAAKAYRVYYKKNEPEPGDEDYYLVDHMAFTYLVTPGEGFLEFFRREVSADDMAARVQCFLEAS